MTRYVGIPINAGLLLLIVACAGPPKPTNSAPAEDIVVLQGKVVDCQWKAADRFDDGNYTIAELARRVMGVCAVEMTKARMAVGLLHDPQVEVIELEQAVKSVESARATRRNSRR